MEQAAIGIGGNVGSAELIIARFAAALRAVAQWENTTLEAYSSIYKSAPWGDVNQPPFLNMAAMIKTEFGPGQILQRLKDLEVALGRIPGRRWGPREIDLDILIFGSQLIQLPGLTIPHPQLLNRAFAALPLLEIWPDAVMPGGLAVSDAISKQRHNWPPMETHGELKLQGE